ncbi:shikimate dehydrogenase [Massilia sp. Dwa41.01b]|uniref:shikimate dehydrogenase n=1 Tax=unclassified Massilia TaxID=2609279 RepID=UPI00160296BF|nr:MULTISPECIES: shikimate dehydrogenase [unclassified Massilia]QNA90411.1 shikimate dehydrogenase [Massilia sp. Dwa41.01b]QNA97638.1 shikimate dehydrogenase [Massilia sp. Se16.2.3]
MSGAELDRYCVIGNPIAHSKSPEIHPVFAAQTGQRLVYERCLAPLDGFAATVRGLVAQGYKGANVTVPFKLEAAALATHLSARARAAGAVNTLSFIDGAIHGDNTDGPGLVADIVRNAGVALAGKRILLLGAGGAARGILLPFLEQGPESILLANRTVATAEALVANFPGFGTQLAACGFGDITGSFDIVVNATSASLNADLPPVPGTAFTEKTLAVDIMYGDKPTPFMAFSAAQGACTRDGLGMLVEQAAEAFAIWRGVRPETGDVFRKLRH